MCGRHGLGEVGAWCVILSRLLLERCQSDNVDVAWLTTVMVTTVLDEDRAFIYQIDLTFETSYLFFSK